jgi:predicted outer membrane protein
MDYAAKYYKNASPANKKKFNSLVSDLRIDMSLDSAVSEGLRQMRQEIKTTSGGKKFNTGGFINMKDYYKGML